MNAELVCTLRLQVGRIRVCKDNGARAVAADALLFIATVVWLVLLHACDCRAVLKHTCVQVQNKRDTGTWLC